MNPNWTGRSARTLSECRFTDDADPFERQESRGYGGAWWAAIVVIAVVGVMLIVHGAAQ